MTNLSINGVSRPMTAEEQAEYDAKCAAWDSKSAERKLTEIKEIRLNKLKETDYMANSDYTMPDNIKTWRQSLRDIPQDNTTEAKYDELLARDEQNNLTHSIWEKP
jgi:hypothetical protein|tara:strand:- start:805 stop:1122 length:318 start_codon:yes stop_codon:yes gene_type:complete